MRSLSFFIFEEFQFESYLFSTATLFHLVSIHACFPDELFLQSRDSSFTVFAWLEM